MNLRHTLSVRLPADVVPYLRAKAERDASSQNSVLIRLLRKEMERDSLIERHGIADEFEAFRRASESGAAAYRAEAPRRTDQAAETKAARLTTSQAASAAAIEPRPSE